MCRPNLQEKNWLGLVYTTNGTVKITMAVGCAGTLNCGLFPIPPLEILEHTVQTALVMPQAICT